MIHPPYLSPGDTIGMVCPSGYMPLENVQQCIAAFEKRGYTIKLGKTVGHQFHYFAGTDAERLADLQSMLNDHSIDAILCGRGGYGLSRIIDQIDFSEFVKHPKWLIGFSDITVLHAHIYSCYGIATIHAPMAAAFNNNLSPNPFTDSLFSAIEGKELSYSIPANPLNKTGNVMGKLIGGNLTIIAHLVGSVSAFNTKDKILFIEDIGEHLYNIDRMLYQLKRNGSLAHLKGLIVGGFTDMKDTTIPFGASIQEIVYAHIKDYNYPVCFDFPISHNTENYAVKIGMECTLSINDTVARFLQKP
ncbi:MAG: LD-carboxypeptidase [Bacteroidota bacterium]